MSPDDFLQRRASEKRAVQAIRLRIHKRGLGQTELGELVGRSQGWISSRLLRSPDETIRHLAYKEPETLKRLLRALEWTLLDLNTATGLDIPVAPSMLREAELVNPDMRAGTRSILVYDLLSAGPGSDGGTAIEQIDIPDYWHGEYAAYKVTGDSMLPEIRDGSTVIIHVQDHASPGNIIVAWVPEVGMVVKELSRVEPDGRHVLTSLNPLFSPIWAKDIRIYGIVRETRNAVKTYNGNGRDKHGPN